MTAVKDVQYVDVAIVGGGPTGLFAALLLHRLGVSICVLDAKPRSLELGRADALNARTQQYFQLTGLLDEILPLGIKCNTSSTFANGKFMSHKSDWWESLEHVLHKNFLMIGQPVVEEMLSRRLPGLVCYDQRVTSIMEDDDLVKISTDSARTIHCRYAIGADGARSTVRHHMGVSFTGTKPGMLWAVLDTFIDSDFPSCPEIITFQLDGQSRVAWIPRERGLCRFYVLLDGDISLERAEESIRQHMAPYRIHFRRTEWFSTFEVKERVASSFVSKGGVGRILLAGDAAHVHSVNGGQGLNTGIADAFALAWRLAIVLKSEKVLRGGAADALICSYDLERRRIAQGVVELAATLVRDTTRKAEHYVATIERNAGYITGMGVSYSALGSPLVEISQNGIWKAGERCPDVILATLDGNGGKVATRLYSQVCYGKYLVLLIGRHTPPGKVCGAVAVSYRILSLSGPEEDDDHGGQKLEVDDGPADETESQQKVFAADWVKRDDSLAVVVRPDMYVGYVGADLGACRLYLSELYRC